MAERICWNCGANDWDFEGQFSYRCKSCNELERDVRCRKCLRPLFLAATATSFTCPHCGKGNNVRPGVLEGHR